MSEVEQKLKQLGYTLDPPKAPVANYLGSKQDRDLLYVSGRKSELIGSVGRDVTEQQAKMAARDTILLVLAIVKNDIGDLDKIKGVVKMQGFIKSAADFIHQPQVLDGATELLIQLFGENGRHARTATGVSQLPYGATIQIDLILKLKTE